MIRIAICDDEKKILDEVSRYIKSYDEKGNLKFVYMKEDIGGFAFHLIKK